MLGYDEHVVEILCPPVLLTAVVAGIGMQFLGELLFGRNCGHDNSRNRREAEKVPESYLLDRPGILRDNVHIDTQILESPTGEPRDNRESETALRALTPNGSALTDRKGLSIINALVWSLV